ncbi:murein hydrolase activator EnvC family protein [Eionea flava]
MLSSLNHFLLRIRHCTWLISLGVLVAYSAELRSETEAEYQQRLQALSETIETLQNELRSTKSDKDKLQTSLRASEEKQAELSKKIIRIKEALAREKKQLTQLQRQRVELDKAKDQQQQGIDLSLRQAYKMGQHSQLKLLLNQEAVTQTGRLSRYHQYIVEARQTAIVHYNSTLNQLSTIEQKIQASSKQLAQQQQSLDKQQHTLRSTQKQRLSVMKKIQQSLSNQSKQLSKLNADQQRLQALLDEATKALSNLSLPENTTPFKQLRGQLPYPTQGKVLQAYGKPQFGGKLKRNGVLIGNAMGADVVAVHYGRVIFADYLRGHGLLLIIDHGDGYMSLYGHNEALLKAVGEWVTAGEKIATVGNSGGQTQVGLYFEIRRKGTPINPQPWLARN